MVEAEMTERLVGLTFDWATEDFLNAAYSQMSDASLIAPVLRPFARVRRCCNGQISALSCQGSKSLPCSGNKQPCYKEGMENRSPAIPKATADQAQGKEEAASLAIVQATETAITDSRQ